MSRLLGLRRAVVVDVPRQLLLDRAKQCRHFAHCDGSEAALEHRAVAAAVGRVHVYERSENCLVFSSNAGLGGPLEAFATVRLDELATAQTRVTASVRTGPFPPALFAVAALASLALLLLAVGLDKKTWVFQAAFATPVTGLFWVGSIWQSRWLLRKVAQGLGVPALA